MAFVLSAWYFVILALVAGIAASLVVFFKMDKQDRVMIDEFVKSNQPKQDAEPKIEQVKAE